MVGTSVANRLEHIRARVAAACARVGRSPQSVRILAVSKGQSLDKIRAAFDHGQTCFAENYVQEAQAKLEQLANLPVEWHFIGRIQSNKVKALIGRFAVIHSVDRLSIAKALNDHLPVESVQSVFMQYNVADEVTKGGGSEAEIRELAGELSKLPHLRVRGLMVMPPLFDDVERVRPFFRRAKALAVDLGLSELSMGTSADFEVAIEEGATWVRIGTDIFGPREVKA